MNESQHKINLRAHQWERILDLAMMGVKVVERFIETDPAEYEQDLAAYNSLKASLVRANVIDDECVGNAPNIVIHINERRPTP